MVQFTPSDEDWQLRTRASFDRQRVMDTLGARMVDCVPGRVVLAMPFSNDLTQQHGFLHAGMIAALLDSACGYAAFTLMPSGSGVLTVEYKINLLAPAVGDEFLAEAEVLRAGRTLTVARGSAFGIDGAARSQVAEMQATMMAITGREDVVG